MVIFINFVFYSGGLETLFRNQKSIDVVLPENQTSTIAWLLAFLRDNHFAGSQLDLFMSTDSM